MSQKDLELHDADPKCDRNDPPAPLPPASPAPSVGLKQSPSLPPPDIVDHEDNAAAIERPSNPAYTPHPTSRPPVSPAPLTENVISIPPVQPEASTSTIPPPPHPKPKSTKPRKSRSPSPPAVAPPPPLLTVRLAIALGGPENYEVDISSLALKTGQRNPTPPPVKRDTSDSEGEDTDDPKSKGKGKEKEKAGKRVGVVCLRSSFGLTRRAVPRSRLRPERPLH